MAAGRGAEIASLKRDIENTLGNQREDGQLVLAFESDQLILYDPARDWKISYLDTRVTPQGANPSTWNVQFNASLDQVMQGLTRPATLLKSELWMNALTTPMKYALFINYLRKQK